MLDYFASWLGYGRKKPEENRRNKSGLVLKVAAATAVGASIASGCSDESAVGSSEPVNNPPEIEYESPKYLGDVEEGATETVFIKAYDPDGDQLTKVGVRLRNVTKQSHQDFYLPAGATEGSLEVALAEEGRLQVLKIAEDEHGAVAEDLAVDANVLAGLPSGAPVYDPENSSYNGGNVASGGTVSLKATFIDNNFKHVKVYKRVGTSGEWTEYATVANGERVNSSPITELTQYKAVGIDFDENQTESSIATYDPQSMDDF